ncbi:MAG: N-acetylglucosamine kinase [Bacteroidota bacterium]
MKLIAESGSTKTDWRLIAKDGQISQCKTIGLNPYYQDQHSISEELLKNLLPYVKEEVSEVYYYGTGVTNDEKAEVLRQAIRQVFPAAQHIEAHTDMLAAARALCGHEAGIACILGTGSNSCFYDGDKISFQIPPLGFWLGDEGSGGHLGKQLILSYLHKEMPEDLRAKFEKRFGVIDRLTIIENGYQKPFPNRYFASFSKFLFDSRQNPFAYQLVSDSFGLFFEKYLLKYPDVQQYKVHFTGSVAFYYSDILRRVANDKGCTLGVIMESPIAGLTLFHK